MVASRCRGVRIGVVAAACLAGLVCSRGGESSQKIVVTGSSTVAPLMSEIGKRFEETHPGVRVDVQTGGSSRGVNDARQGLNDIGMASRAANDDEKDMTFVPIALDGIAMIVHTSNPVRALSADQVRAIYLDEISNWSQLGGPDLAITVVNKSEGRSTLELFLKYFKLEAPAIKADVIVGDNAQDIKSVATDPSAVGYVSVGTAEFETKRGTTLKALPLDGVEPTIESVRAGTFPLARPLNLVTAKPAEGLTKELIEFAASPQVRDLVEGQFFVPLANNPS
jgi:phosphate transport system substrate-binding protein